jgi:hypothetical protein
LIPIFEVTVSMALRELTPQDWAALYRVLAYEAGRGVHATTGPDRDSWASVVHQWEHLAHKADVDALAEIQNGANAT